MCLSSIHWAYLMFVHGSIRDYSPSQVKMSSSTMYKSYCRCITGGLSQRHVHSRICRYNRSGSVTEEHVSEPSLSLTADRAALSPSQSANNFGEPGGLHRASRIRNALLDLTKWLRDFLPHPPRLGRDRDLQVTWHTLRGTRPSRVVQSPVFVDT